jgi:GMP synthase (glutamine-hydrolysing)
MKPVLILQHLEGDGPAYLATWLRDHGVPLDVRDSSRGDALPDRIEDFAALAILGGEMSANDPLPALRRAETLFRQALSEGVPTLGHCLGGQLMARALGAAVTHSPAPEVGWQPLEVLDAPEARTWLGAPGERMVYHWHYEAFELPRGGVPLARSTACPNQAFAIGPHLAMQFHVEVDAAKLARWSADEGPRYRQALGAHPQTVQSPSDMRAATVRHLALQQRLADRIYGQWWSRVVGA